MVEDHHASMLIPFSELIRRFGIQVRGVLHVGAHEAEELGQYVQAGVSPDRIVWIDAQQDKIDALRARGVPKVIQAFVDEEDDKDIVFHVTNNGQSSSLLALGTHAMTYPDIVVVRDVRGRTRRLDTLIDEHHLPIQDLNFLNLDIQGTELRAMRSLGHHLRHIDYIYTEVNTEEVYEGADLLPSLDAFLERHGFARVATSMVDGAGWGDAFYQRVI